MRAVPALLRVSGLDHQAFVAQSIGQIDPELLGVAHSLAYLFDQLVHEGDAILGAIVRQRLLVKVQRLQLQLAIVSAPALAQNRPATAGEHPLRHILAVLLEIHDRLGDLQVDGSHQHLDVERPDQPVGDLIHGICTQEAEREISRLES